MARVVDHIARVSDSFDALDTMTQSDIVCELFTRLSDPAKAAAIRRIQFHMRMCESRRPQAEPELPELMPREEVERNGKLALHEGAKQ